MTTVLAYGDGERVWMAADSMTNVYDRPIVGVKKIRRFATGLDDIDALIGTSGAGGMAAAMELVGVRRLDGHGDLDRWAQLVAESITHIAVQRGFVEDGQMFSTLLLACSGRVWTITHNYAIAHPLDDNMGAVGSGEGPAMGAMDAIIATDTYPDTTGYGYVRFAMDIAAKRDRYTGGEIQVEQA